MIASGGLVRPVATSCDTHRVKPSFTCLITYLGKVVTYRVTAVKNGDKTVAVQITIDDSKISLGVVTR